MRIYVPAIAASIVLLWSFQSFALDQDTVQKLAAGENDARIEAIDSVVSHGDVTAIPFLEKLLNDSVKISGDKVFVMDGDKASDAVTGAPATLPEDADDVVNSNRIRLRIASAVSALKLASPDRETRLAAAKAILADDADEAKLPLLQAAEAKEHDTAIKELLVEARANIELTSPDKAVRLAAVGHLTDAANPNIREVLSTRLVAGNEADLEVRTAITVALKSIDSRAIRYEYMGRVFTGISLGSILLLAALGLAITYGLMGVINMAHGELMMIGAYATYLIQNLFKAYFPGAFEYYLIPAIPAAFLITAGVGMVIERTVLKHLYGRSLETLLATWGLSLILMQGVRSLFGAQNVQVENPSWISGAFSVASNLVLPYNRIIIIGFSIMVLAAVWLVLTRTRLGLFVRAVTQNRTMARCVGVNTGKIDTMAFGLGSGIAGLAGVALSQIGNVGPDLGQNYIVNSFMVVVLGGVGQLAGTVFAAVGLGIISKFLENVTGAVIAEILVLIIVIVFIQKRPSGLFALTGRSAEI